MAVVSLFQDDFSLGMKRNLPFNRVQPGALWQITDMIPNEIVAPLEKRGGWTYSSNALGAGTYTAAMGYADFAAGGKKVAINNAGTLYSIPEGSLTVTSEGSAHVPVAPMVMHRDILVIPSSDGTVTAKKYVATTPADLSATAPAGMYAAVFKDRTILANVAAAPHRVYFGPGGLPTGTWDTTNSFIDASFPVKALAAMKNVLLVFGANKTEIIRGSIPPPNTDMVREPLFNIGTLDARTVAAYGDNVIFANAQGIWMTDGAALENIAKTSGMLPEWLAFQSSAITVGFSAGVYRGYYVCSLYQPSDGSAFITIFLNIARRTWFTVTNLTASMFAAGPTELYFGERRSPRVGAVSPVFAPTDGTRNDADGTAVLAYLQTGLLHDRVDTTHRWRRLYLSYELNAPSTAPTMTVAYATGLEHAAGSGLTTLSTHPGETTTLTRTRLALGIRSRELGFVVTQSAASAFTRIYDIGIEGYPLEGSR